MQRTTARDERIPHGLTKNRMENHGKEASRGFYGKEHNNARAARVNLFPARAATQACRAGRNTPACEELTSEIVSDLYQ